MRKIGVLATSLTLLAGLNFAFAGENVIELGGLTSKIPAGWKMQKPSNNLRKYQVLVPRVEGDKEDAELAVFSFGASGKEDNVKRWKAQFIAPEGKTLDDVSKTEDYKVGKVAEARCPTRVRAATGRGPAVARRTLGRFPRTHPHPPAQPEKVVAYT